LVNLVELKPVIDIWAFFAFKNWRRSSYGGQVSAKVGELVVSSGAVELAGHLHNLETQRAKVALETASGHDLGDRQ